ncbi:ROK family protein [Spirilliplanes yamanashiensis]|uniref:Xylose repressor n=1 Tax=Spirilliplanes yamanashiensis TaxID=42233 RepID=A0A8J3YBT6_9ACTN|nr:ROK family protein [Spirilliplanes yamanashiensis]MDP9816324.1 putative NBD/HSP70 family sugar kinase [Spirilliplanes yamanashiensis]GIJ05851.1 xylose repressor [Spirilliplanes yamanashiensis]
MHARLLNPRGAPVRQAGVRAHNLALVLRHVAGAATPPSRAAIAAATGLTRATVSALVDDLVAGTLLTELTPAPRAGAGRPAVGLALSPDGPAGLGLEVNVDYLSAAVVDFTGHVRHRVVRHLDQRPAGADRTLQHLSRLAGEALTRAGTDGLTIAGGALAVPGLVTGDLVKVAPNLDWRDVDPIALLRRATTFKDIPLTVDNEANLAALGELHATPGTPTFVYISGEIGIGAGIVVDGALFRGVRGFSGEIGHIPVHPDGPACRCGARGCLEQYAGQEAILRAAGVPLTGRPDESLATLAAWAAAGDATTLTALAGAATALGTAVSTVVNLLDVDTVILGGSYAPLLPWLHDGVNLEIARRVLTAAWTPVTIQAATLGPSAAVTGAGDSVIRTIRDDPATWLSRR